MQGSPDRPTVPLSAPVLFPPAYRAEVAAAITRARSLAHVPNMDPARALWLICTAYLTRPPADPFFTR